MKAMLICGLVLGLAVAANATIVLQDDFGTDGGLVGTSPVVGEAWAAHSGAGALAVQVVSGAAVLAQGSGSREDVNSKFAGNEVAGAGEKFYAGFDLVVAGGNTAVYFAHFKNATTNFNARAWVKPAQGGGDYAIALTEASSGSTLPTAAETWASDLTYGTSYRVVLSYDYDSKTSTMWVNPVDESSQNVVSVGPNSIAIEGFALRQAGGDSTQAIDNLIVATSFAEVVPEPATMAFLLLGGLFLVRRR